MSEEQYFRVYFTADLKKKLKRFRDGFIRVKGKTCELTDEEGKVVSRSTNYRAEIDDADEKVGYLNTFMIRYDCEIKKEDFITGRCYRPNFNPNGPMPASSSHLPVKKSKFKNPVEANRSEDIDRQKVHILCDREKDQRVAYTCYIEQFLKDELMPHQVEGVQFMFDRLTGKHRIISGLCEQGEFNGCILADSMGLGKTLQIITLFWTLLRQNPFGSEAFLKKVVVVAPVSLVKNWQLETNTW